MKNTTTTTAKIRVIFYKDTKTAAARVYLQDGTVEKLSWKTGAAALHWMSKQGVCWEWEDHPRYEAASWEVEG